MKIAEVTLPFGVLTSTAIWSVLAHPVRVIPTEVPTDTEVLRMVDGKVFATVHAKVLVGVLSTADAVILVPTGMGFVPPSSVKLKVIWLTDEVVESNEAKLPDMISTN